MHAENVARMHTGSWPSRNKFSKAKKTIGARLAICLTYFTWKQAPRKTQCPWNDLFEPKTLESKQTITNYWNQQSIWRHVHNTNELAMNNDLKGTLWFEVRWYDENNDENRLGCHALLGGTLRNGFDWLCMLWNKNNCCACDALTGEILGPYTKTRTAMIRNAGWYLELHVRKTEDTWNYML